MHKCSTGHGSQKTVFPKMNFCDKIQKHFMGTLRPSLCCFPRGGGGGLAWQPRSTTDTGVFGLEGKKSKFPGLNL